MPTPAPIPLYLVIPCHLPISAGQAQYRDALARCYLPLIEALEACRGAHVCLHFGGHLLDMLARHDEHVLLRLQALVGRGQVEILGGLFYGGPVALLPEADVRAQVAMSQEFWASFTGLTPQGIFFPQLAWAPEMPRLLEDTGILYSFIGSSQRMPGPGHPAFMGRIERGGLPLYTFTLDAELSMALAPDDIGGFVQRLRAHHTALSATSRPPLHGEAPSLGLGLCIPAELFGVFGVGTQAGGSPPRIEALLRGLEGEALWQTELPMARFRRSPPVQSIALGDPYAPPVPASFRLDALHDWSQFPGHFAEADTLHRRMLRTSVRLRREIARMEDEGLEARMSDVLATAQRALFAAQSIDAFSRALWPGFSDPAVRDAVMDRLLSAEAVLDGLEPSPPALACEVVDLDGDRIDDLMITTASLSVWALPGRGGALRSIEHRARRRNVLDAGIRREDPFRAQAILAPELTGGDAAAEAHLRLLPRLGGPISQSTDVCERRGVRDWLVSGQARPGELLTGHVRSLADIRRPWHVVHSGPVGEGDALHQRLQLQCQTQLSCGGGLQIDKEVRVYASRPQVVLRYALEPLGAEHPADAVRWATEVPLRLCTEGCTMHIDGQAMPAQGEHPATGRTASVHGGGARVHVEVRALAGDGVEPAFWWAQRETLVRRPDGFVEVPAGLVLLVTLPIVGACSWEVVLTF